jgi:hypothetical protein
VRQPKKLDQLTLLRDPGKNVSSFSNGDLKQFQTSISAGATTQNATPLRVGLSIARNSE